MKIKVLIVDDSAIVRGLMAKALTADGKVQITGTASNGVMAISMAKELRPDIIIMDIEMPVMDGITALPQILKETPGTKVIISSKLTAENANVAIQALALGAADYITKPSSKLPEEIKLFYKDLLNKVRAIADIRIVDKEKDAILNAPSITQEEAVITPAIPHSSSTNYVSAPIKAIAIASSTGGPQALVALFESIKGRTLNVPVFITQHMPPNFTTVLADHLAKASGRKCTESKTGDVVEAGAIYLAAGDFHMVPEKNQSGQVVIRNSQDDPENFCRPAADPMLRALSKIYRENLLVVVLTGMGQDALTGCKEVVQKGGIVIAQDEASCVVYGMPRAVAENNLCKAVLPLVEIGNYIAQQVEVR